MARNRLEEYDKGQLLAEIATLNDKLKKRTSDLHKARTRLAASKGKIHKLKAAIVYQRARILQLYRFDDLIRA
jgi:hypothetical protein